MNLSVVTMSPPIAGVAALPLVPAPAGPDITGDRFVPAVPKNAWMEPPQVAIPHLFSTSPPPSGAGGAGTPPANAGGGSDNGGPPDYDDLPWPEQRILRQLLLDRCREWLLAKDYAAGLERFRQLSEEKPAIAEHVRDIIEHKNILGRLRDAESMRRVVFNLELYARQVTAEAGRVLDTGGLEETVRYMRRISTGVHYVIGEVLRDKIGKNPPFKGLVRDGEGEGPARVFAFDDLQRSFSIFHAVERRDYAEVIAGLLPHASRLHELRFMRTIGDQARGHIANAVFPWAFVGALRSDTVTEIDVRPDLKLRKSINRIAVELIFSGLVRKMMGLVGSVEPPAHLSIKWNDSTGAFHIESDAANLSPDTAEWTTGFHRAVSGKDYYDSNGGLPLVRDLAQKIGWKIDLNVDEHGVRFKLTPAEGDVLMMDDDERIMMGGPGLGLLVEDDHEHLKNFFITTTIGALEGNSAARATLEGMREDVFLGPVVRSLLDNFDLFRAFMSAGDLDAFGRASQVWLEYMTGGFFERLKAEGAGSSAGFARDAAGPHVPLIDRMFKLKFAPDGHFTRELEVFDHDFVSRLGNFRGNFSMLHYAMAVTGQLPRLNAMRAGGRNFADARGWAIKTLFPYVVFGATRNVMVEVNVPDGLNLAAGLSADQMGFALAELVYNAIKYRDEKKTERWVRVSYEDGSLVVADNGIGVGQKFLERIFWLGFRREGHDGIEGQGIGLASVRSRISKMGLGIRVESTEGEGARFVISRADGWPILV